MYLFAKQNGEKRNEDGLFALQAPRTERAGTDERQPYECRAAARGGRAPACAPGWQGCRRSAAPAPTRCCSGRCGAALHSDKKQVADAVAAATADGFTSSAAAAEAAATAEAATAAATAAAASASASSAAASVTTIGTAAVEPLRVYQRAMTRHLL